MNTLSVFFKSSLSEFELRQTYGVGVSGPEVSRFEKFMKHTGYETPNEYEIYSGEECCGRIQEIKKPSLVPFSLKKAFFSGRRGILFSVTDESGNIILYIKKPWHLLVSTYTVLSADEQPLAFVWRRLDPLFNKYDILFEDKKPFARINSSVAKPWTFPVLDPRQGREIGKIRKKIPSLGEAMTYRDTLHVRCDGDFSNLEKALFLATALAIAIDKFDNSAGPSG